MPATRHCCGSLTLIAVVAVLTLSCSPQGDLENGALDQAIRHTLGDFRGSVGVYAEDTITGRTYGLRENTIFPTASVFKVPVMIEFFRRVENIELLLDETREVGRGVSRHGTGVLKDREPGARLPLLELCRLMIARSDNVATDTLMQTISPASVSTTMDNLGYPNTHVGGNCTEMHYRMAGIDSRIGSPRLDAVLLGRARSGNLIEAGFASASPDANVTTPREMGQILKRIHEGKMISTLASQQMLEILKQTTHHDVIPKHLPAGVEVAHKTGGTWRVKADVGIVYLDSGPIVMSLFAYYHPSETRAAEVLAEVARLLADWAQEA